MTDRSKYESEVFYEAWRRGVDPERATQCASDCYYDRRSPEECVDGTAREIRREREARQMAKYEEERQIAEANRAYYEQQQPDEEPQ